VAASKHPDERFWFVSGESIDVSGGSLYEVGDKVVYPHHGAGKIVKKEIREMLGQKREYLTIKILYNEMTVMVPTENADKAGLRKVIGEDAVEQVLAVLRGDGTHMPKNWNRRFKHNRDKIKTGDIFELAEVVRNLSIRDLDKGLSTGEKQMFGRAKKILASELMYARDMGEQEATDFLENLLEEIGARRLAQGGATRARAQEALVDTAT
jgi:CarD family transcriptional regulator